MNLDAITAAVGGLVEYGGRVCVASNLTAALESFKPFKATPVCVVFGVEERAGKNELSTGCVRQRVSVTIRLLTGARDVSDPHGNAAYKQADTARAALLPALLGLVPDTKHDPLEYQSGRLVYSEAGTLLYQDDFTTAYYLSSN